jgi:hypothetical protein
MPFSLQSVCQPGREFLKLLKNKRNIFEIIFRLGLLDGFSNGVVPQG